MALAPIPLVSESYQLASTPAAQHRLVNLYAEALPDAGRAKFYLKSTPGLIQGGLAGSGPIHAMAAVARSLFVISGSNAYVLQESVGGFGAPTLIRNVGTVANDLTNPSITIGLNAVIFCVPPYAYVSSLDGLTVNQIVPGSGNFPAAGVSSVTYLDGYYIFTETSGANFFTSDLLAPTAYTGMSYAKMSSEVDFFVACRAHNGELWLFGRNTVSVWYNTGDPITPFSPRSGAVIRKGLISGRSIAELDGSLWWLAADRCIYRTVGYQAKRVSTHAIEEVLSDPDTGTLRTAIAGGFTHEGHSFYSLSIPDIGRTFVYDCATEMWHERSSGLTGTGRWAINTAAQTAVGWLLGDSSDGTIWAMSRDAPLEKALAMRRIAQLPALVTHGPRAFMSRLEIEMQTGRGDGGVSLAWSDDGGTAFTTPRLLDTGTAGQLRKRVATTRLGSFRQRVLQMTCNFPLTVYGVDVDMGAGDS